MKIWEVYSFPAQQMKTLLKGHGKESISQNPETGNLIKIPRVSKKQCTTTHACVEKARRYQSFRLLLSSSPFNPILFFASPRGCSFMLIKRILHFNTVRLNWNTWIVVVVVAKRENRIYREYKETCHIHVRFMRKSLPEVVVHTNKISSCVFILIVL